MQREDHKYPVRFVSPPSELWNAHEPCATLGSMVVGCQTLRPADLNSRRDHPHGGSDRRRHGSTPYERCLHGWLLQRPAADAGMTVARCRVASCAAPADRVRHG